MGSSSTSSQQYSTTNTTETVNASLDNNQGFAVGAIKTKGDISIQTTDAGAVKQAAALSMAALQSVDSANKNALNFAAQAKSDSGTARLQLAVMAIMALAIAGGAYRKGKG